jgi:putative membrane protein
MQFLKTLFWVVIAVLLAIVASRNWHEVTVNLWGNLQMDIKVPVLMGLMFLVGFLPIFLVYRARLWTLNRRIEGLERQQAAHRAPEPVAEEPEAQ